MSLPGLDQSVPPTVHVETMNPARAQMLAEIAQEELTKPPPVAKIDESAPLITGANLSVLGDPSLRAPRGSQRPGGSGVPPSSSSTAGLPSLRETKSSDIGGSAKRSISDMIKEEANIKREKKRKFNPHHAEIQPTKTHYTEVQSLGCAPEPDPNTQYLTSLLRNRTLTLYLQPAATKKSFGGSGIPKTYNFLISQAGMIQHEKLSMLGHTRAFPLSLHDQDISTTEGAFTRTVIGELLEDVWPRLEKSEKFMYARQLRNLLHKMRVASKAGPDVHLGSIDSGPYSLLQDKHPDHTYYAIRKLPSQKQFMALLMSTMYETVPKPVARALVSQFRTDYPSVLTHGALCPKNIVVSNNTISWILGWDCAGQYPVWWEYVRFFEARTSDANSDWYSYAADIFEDEFPVELAAYQGMARCQQP